MGNFLQFLLTEEKIKIIKDNTTVSKSHDCLLNESILNAQICKILVVSGFGALFVIYLSMQAFYLVVVCTLTGPKFCEIL